MSGIADSTEQTPAAEAGPLQPCAARLKVVPFPNCGPSRTVAFIARWREREKTHFSESARSGAPAVSGCVGRLKSGTSAIAALARGTGESPVATWSAVGHGDLRESSDLGQQKRACRSTYRQARLGSFEGAYAAVSTAPVVFICLAASSSCLDCWIWPSIP